MEFSFVLDGAYRWVAGQEIIDTWDYQHWIRSLEDRDDVTAHMVDRSVQGRPVYLAETADRAEFVLFIGRQHPPEVTGAIGMKAFMNTVFADTELARQFRERFKLGVVPLMNPDGVVAGHWRHNLGHLDINRDWGPFTQPETRLVGDLLDEFDAGDYELRMFVDFHSTDENVFYTQQEPTNPAGFTRTWLENAAPRVQNYPFSESAGRVQNAAIAKNYIYSRYDIPAVTFEAGDETDRDAVVGAARIFAEELMRLMLEQEY